MKLAFEGMDRKFGLQFLNQVKNLFSDGEGIELLDPFANTGRAGVTPCDIVFFAQPNAIDPASLRERYGSALFVALSPDGQEVPQTFLHGDVDELLSLPLRPADVFALFRRLKSHSEVRHLAESQGRLQAALDRLEADVNLAEQLQKAVLPVRFPDIRGFQVRQRYLAGLRGGDWFDIAETRDGSALHLVLSDGSSSGLSSSVGAALTRVAMKVSLETSRDPLLTVRALHSELQTVMSEKHRLSLLYGVISRAELKLRYLALGGARWIYQPVGESFAFLESQGGVIGKSSELPADLKARELSLSPQDRLLLISDGFLEGMGGEEKVLQGLEELKGASIEDILNDWAWRLRQGLADDELPPQESSALGIEVDSRVIRLARSVKQSGPE